MLDAGACSAAKPLLRMLQESYFANRMALPTGSQNVWSTVRSAVNGSVPNAEVESVLAAAVASALVLPMYSGY